MVAAQAGAVDTDLDGDRASGAFCLASAPGVAEELRMLLVGAGARDA